MKNLPLIVAVVISLAIGFGLGRYCHRPHGSHDASPLLGSGWSSMQINPNTMLIKAQRGIAHTNDSYYAGILTYSPDSVNIASFDTFNAKNGLTISNVGASYTFTAARGAIDSVPHSVWVQNSTTLVDTTIYSRLGTIYGKDATGKSYTINSNDIISVQAGPGSGCVVFGSVNVELYNSVRQ